MARRPLRTVVLVLVGAAVLAGGAWAIKRGTADPPVSFRTARLDRGPVEQAVTATGSVSAVVTVQVGSQVSGVIAKLGADFNSRVVEGQIIAQIDPTRFKATLEQNEATLKASAAAVAHAVVAVRQAKQDLDRAEALVKREVLGAAELDLTRNKYELAQADEAEAVARVAQARASVGAARVDLERTTIRAPIAGTVLQRAVDVGQTVAASLQAPVLFTIAQDLSRMEAHAAIDEADVGKIREGQEATFTVDAYPGEIFRATIFQIRSQPNVQQNVVTYDAVVRFDNPGSKLRPGMTATVRVVSVRKDDVLRVPNAALRFKPPADLILGGAPAGPDRPTGDKNVTASAARAPSTNATPTDTAPGVGQPATGAPVATTPAGRSAGAGAGLGGGPGTDPGLANAGREGGRPSGAGAQGRSRGRVFRPAGDKVAPIAFKPGISDDEFTEVVAGELKAGDDVVLDLGGASGRPGGASGPSSSGGGRRAPRMF